MSSTKFTNDQKIAIETTGKSLLVSAAAGSGKTSVLAERCARLMCEAIDGKPCEVSELLVVTFTEAAAAQMRSRIGDAMRKRLETSPNRRHIEEQLALLPAASISTIHSFCLDLIRRWFTVAEIDPLASVLDAEEASLLQHETLKDLFDELYDSDAAPARAFQSLVEEDFDGRDSDLTELILKTHDFLRSLPDPKRWIAETANRFATQNRASLKRLVNETRFQQLTTSIQRLKDWVDNALIGWPEAGYEECGQLREMRTFQLNAANWLERLGDKASASILDAVGRDIQELSLNASGKRKKTALSEADVERAKLLFDALKKLIGKRLKDSLTTFTSDEYIDGLEQVGPRCTTLLTLVQQFDERYQAAKREENLLDFSDLEQIAYRILHDPADPARPSNVARRCHEQYRYVLIDEFQDVNPIQEAILRMVSREASDGPDHADNLFVVGDVKQCIYAFRLAAPRLFLDRANRFRDGKTGQLVPLRENFRSRGRVLRAINDVFYRCMTPELGGIRYDEDAALRAGLTFPPTATDATFDDTPVELHLLSLPSKTKSSEDEDEDSKNNAESDSLLDGLRVEREAYLIARRIQEFMGMSKSGIRRRIYDRGSPAADESGYRPLEFRDMVILLRAMSHKADPIANMLRQMDIPVHADLRSGYFETSELRDMLALLSLLDNGQQDIPLAAVMRSPLSDRNPFNTGDLVRIRTHSPKAAFCEAVDIYAKAGPDTELRERVQIFLARIERWRNAARDRNLADVIWHIYEETGYLAWVGGLPHGRQRRANLIGLHDRARQFGSFRKQGLRRFLLFIEQLKKRESDLAPPSAASEADNVVRILSVHHSKGLEFPVVFAADLGAVFNQRDIHRTVVMHRDAGLGMKVVDAERRIVYPSLAFEMAAEALRLDMLAEEQRILYVAMTRAREHLVLVGSASDGAITEAIAASDSDLGAVDTLSLEHANKPLDWLLAAVARMESEARPTCGLNNRLTGMKDAVFAVFHHTTNDIGGWSLPENQSQLQRKQLASIAELQSLPEEEPLATNDAEVRATIERLEYLYEPLALSRIPARRTVTELKQAFDPFTESEDRPHTLVDMPRYDAPKFIEADAHKAGSAAERGTLTHRFLQLMDLAIDPEEPRVRQQLTALVASGTLPASAETLVDTAGVTAFLRSELGQRVRRAADRVRREVMFVTRIQPEQIDKTVSSVDHHDVVLLRGMIDIMLPGDDGLEIIDYKTDSITADQVHERTEQYRMQLELYAQAVADIWRMPVKAKWLVFLTPQQIVAI